MRICSATWRARTRGTIDDGGVRLMSMTSGRRALGALLGAVVLAGVPATAMAQSNNLPATSGDPRIGLAGGLTTAGTASLGLEHLANRPLPAAVNGTNSDLAFQGDY